MKLICTAFFLALIIASCGKAIPDETMDGRGTFYCKVNGEDYFPDCQGFACQDVRAIYSTFGDAINISAVREHDDEVLAIRLYMYDLQTNPSIVDDDDPNRFIDNTFILQGCGNTFLNDEHSCTIEFTKIDFEAGTISGTFFGIFSRVEPNHNCIDTIVITDGIFDLPITF